MFLLEEFRRAAHDDPKLWWVAGLALLGLIAAVIFLGSMSDARVPSDPYSLPDPRWPRPRRTRSKRPTTPALAFSGLAVYFGVLWLIVEPDSPAIIAGSLLLFAYFGYRRNRELDLLCDGDLVEAEIHASEVVRFMGRFAGSAYGGRILTVSYEHAGKKHRQQLYVARYDPRESKRVALLVAHGDSENVLVYGDSNFWIVPPGAS